MATDINTILNWFKTGLKPTQAQFWASWTSFWHKDELIPQSSISNLTTVLNAKAEKSQFDAHKIADDAHVALFALKQSLNEKGEAGGYAPLDSSTKIASQYLNIVDNLITGGSNNLLSAEMGKVLQERIDGINTVSFTKITANQYGMHPAFENQNQLNAYLLSTTVEPKIKLNTPEPISAQSNGGDSILIQLTDTNS